MKLLDVLGFYSRCFRIPGRRRLPCPVCGQTALFPVYKQTDGVTVCGVPLLRRQALFISACPACAAVFSVLPAAGRLLERGDRFQLQPRHLCLVQPPVRRPLDKPKP